MQAIVLADGEVAERDRIDAAWPGWDEPDAIVVAADGGLRHAAALGFGVTAWVGDGDSVDRAALQRLEAEGVPVQRASRDKDESDAELAVLEAVRRGAGRVMILGALGGERVDHELANVLLLALPALRGHEACLLDAAARISLIDAPDVGGRPVVRGLPGRVGDRISLLSLGPSAEGVTTHGLTFPLRDEPLPIGPARGLSNERRAADASLTVRSGRLLVIETPATLVP